MTAHGTNATNRHAHSNDRFGGQSGLDMCSGSGRRANSAKELLQKRTSLHGEMVPLHPDLAPCFRSDRQRPSRREAQPCALLAYVIPIKKIAFQDEKLLAFMRRPIEPLRTRRIGLDRDGFACF